jgi:hypothetical protein
MNCACGKTTRSFEKKYLTMGLPSAIIEEIFEYLDNSSEFCMLQHKQDHPICNKCRVIMETRAAAFDTSMIPCPHDGCMRDVFVG